MLYSLSTLLHVLAASVPFVAAQASETPAAPVTTEQLYATLSSTVAPAPGFNAEGGSVFANFVDTVNNKQFFQLYTGSFVFEKPESESVRRSNLVWCSDFTFSDLSNSSLMGYAARCVGMGLSGYAEALAAGAQLTYDYSEGNFDRTMGISAVFVEQLNTFEGQLHINTDDLVLRYWDDGRKTMPMIGWEGHDQGDMSANAATSSLSYFGETTWTSVEEVAQLLNTTVDEFTPETFKQVYKDNWIKEHEQEAAEKNPNPEDDTDSTDETTSTAAPPGTGGTDTSTPVDDDSSSGRKLASITARFVSAGLRIFGI